MANQALGWAVVDQVLRRLVPGPAIPLDGALQDARRAIASTTEKLATIDDRVLDAPWPWHDGETEIRYAFYRLYELLEAARGDAERALTGGAPRPAAAQPKVAAATAARWDLHGVLRSLSDADLDRDPGDGEWTLRETLAHIVHTQRAYSWFTAWWLAHGDSATDVAQHVPDDAIPEWSDDETADGDGSLGTIRARLDETLDDGAAVMGALDEAALRVPARWSGAAVTVGFRMGRWASHLREHTVQVDKTLYALGTAPGEVDRLIRLVLGAYGRLEAVVFARPAAEVAPAIEVFRQIGREAPALADQATGVARTAWAGRQGP